MEVEVMMANEVDKINVEYSKDVMFGVVVDMFEVLKIDGDWLKVK
ncbi:hypothetical protein [Staphylococcus aureus]|nr:hypothetical protein [Staphylococcus aureus]